jgi:hypothetical protein
MSNETYVHDAMHRWTIALDRAPAILEGARPDDPDDARRLADSSASLHGLLAWIRESCPLAGPEAPRLDWNIALLADAASLLYRELGLTEEAALERLGRLSGAMSGTARQMNGSAVDVWRSLRPTVPTQHEVNARA